MDFPRPIVYVSKCLGFAHCRYDGQMIENNFVKKLEDYVEFRPVCPEVEIGLGIPRKPIRVVAIDEKHFLYQPSSGKDVTQAMEEFVDTFLNGITEVDGFLLKNRSPSCGPQDVKIYPGFENVSRTFRGSGFYGGEVMKRFEGLAIEDEGRIKNFTIREDFLTKLFTFARFREAKKQATIRALTDFHSQHKLMLMGYNQSRMRLMGKILANHEKDELQQVITTYEKHLKLALAKAPRFQSIINVLQHAVGGFSKQLSSEEKQFFLESLEEYRDERIPLSAVLQVLRAWAIQYDNSYLLNQSVMNPYPKSLIAITDSGKGRPL